MIIGGQVPETRIVGEGEEAYEGRAVYIYDCDSEERLWEIAKNMAVNDLPMLTAGCAGFARYLPEMMGLEGELKRQTHYRTEARREMRATEKSQINRHNILKGFSLCPLCLCEKKSFEPIHLSCGSLDNTTCTAYASPAAPRLIICGSLHANSLAQVRRAERDGVFSLRLSEKILTRPDENDIKQLVASLSEHDLTILKTVDNREDASLEPLAAARGLAKIIRAAVERLSLASLAVFGGDTAYAIARELGVSSLKPLTELAEGVPLSVMTYKNKPFYMITKAGGFGGEDIINTILTQTKTTEGAQTCQ
jgi:hypothetical protein